MKSSLIPNVINNISRGTAIYSIGESVLSLALVLKGRVLVHSSGSKVIISAGNFIGVNDLYLGKYVSTYTALEEVMIFIFPVEGKEELDQILSTNNDYHGIMVTSLNKLIFEMDQYYQGLMKLGIRLRGFTTELYQKYLEITKSLSYKANPTDRFDTIGLRETNLEFQRDRINYYREFSKIPLEPIKEFYSYGNVITLYQIEDQSDLVNDQIDALAYLIEDINGMIQSLYDDSDTCLFNLVAALGLEMRNNTGSSSRIISMLENIISELRKSEKLFDVLLNMRVNIDWDRMNEVLAHIQSGEASTSGISNETYLKYSEEDTANALEDLNNSFRKILNFAEVEAEEAEDMLKTLEIYVHSKDKTCLDNSFRALRKKITDHYYDLYRKIFIKNHHNPSKSKIIDMFLNYGFTDERLLTKEQLIYLYYLPTSQGLQSRNKEIDSSEANSCKVYTIKEWLTMIYEGKKEPSKNEFDQDYPDYIRGLYNQGKLTEKEEKESQHNTEQKLKYEIKNMFRYNNRTTNGQITSFVPILHKDMIGFDLEKTFLTSEKLNNVIKEIMTIDYSVFDRQTVYSNAEAKIVKEYIIKRVYPDIILMPTVGTNGIMWQEITGRKRDSAGRFLMPAFMESDLTTTMVRLFGRFRWELCRTVEGVSWNDIKNKSLTSEYTDYLQFYRKNKELSEEKRQKIKLQIQKGRNSSREIFVMDYENWVSNESRAAIKLNKPVREIMATYCPFSKQIREKLMLQPLFEEAMARYQREKLKKVREIEGRYRMLKRDQIELTQELITTLDYYKEL